MKKILLSSIVAIALLTGCGEDKKVAETKPAVEVKQEVVTPAPKVEETKVEAPVETKVEEKTPEAKLVEQVKESASVVADKVVEESKKVAEVVPAAVSSVSEKVATKAEEVTNTVVAAASETKEKIEETINTVVEAKTEEPQVDTAALVEKGKVLFAKCSACHGQDAEKAALGKSQVIRGWEVSKVVEALKGYKDDTYGGVMKGVMKGQVAALGDEDMEALGAYINTL